MRAAGKDVLQLFADLLGLNEVDNQSANVRQKYENGTLNAGDFVTAGVKIGFATTKGEGVPNEDLLQGGQRLPNEDLLYAPGKRGQVPIGSDGHPVELHHTDQTSEGPIDEMTRTDHRLGENFQKNHSNTGGSSSNISRPEFGPLRERHWGTEWDAGRFIDLPKKPTK